MTDKFNPNYYSNLKDDSAMIQAAVDEAAKYGESVTIPRYNERTGEPIWIISRAIKLYSGSVVYLDNCHLRQADNVIENIFKNSNNGTPEGFTREGRQSWISIIGLGNPLLDGGNHNGMTEVNCEEYGHPSAYENCMFNFLNVEQVKVRNIRITHQRYWSFVFHYSSHVQISEINYYAPYHWRNQDGVDIRSGCSHFLIENITGVLGDDVVALTNLKNQFEDPMKDCHYDDSIHNVVIRNLRCTTKYSFVRILNHGGRKIYNVLAQDLMFDCESDPKDPRPGKYVEAGKYEPIHPEIYQFTQDYGIRIGTYSYNQGEPFAQLGDTYNITIRNITCRGKVGVCLSCTAKDVLIDNVRMYGHGTTGVYVAQGPMRNIQVRDVYCSGHPDDDFDDRLYECVKENESPEKDFAALPDRQVCAVYFKDSDVRDMVIRDLHVGDAYTSVFGGYGDVEVEVTGLRKELDETPLNTGVGIKVNEK